jgi:hypothetical protein
MLAKYIHNPHNKGGGEEKPTPIKTKKKKKNSA